MFAFRFKASGSWMENSYKYEGKTDGKAAIGNSDNTSI